MGIDPSWYKGLLQLSAWEVVGATLILTHITILSITLYLHRFSAHNAIDLHPAIQHFFRFWLWLTTGMNTKEWTAIHRKHHAVCETADDPHSPVVRGLNEVLWRGSELYRAEAKNEETLRRFGQRCPEDWVERNVYSRFSGLGITLMFLADVTLFGVIGITVWAVQMIWSPVFAAGVINGIGHYFGYRNFECKDNARNLVPWGILIGGEELHNNHHTYPNSAKFSVRFWEFDIGWVWIRAFKALGLAKVKFTRPLVYRDITKKDIDHDTILAVINNRFQIMDNYRRTVIGPLVKNELAKAEGKKRQILRRAKKLLSREGALLKPDHVERLNTIVESSHALKVIYEKRLALQAIWQTFKDKNDRIEALREWCRQAEASGIRALQDFAMQLRTYTLPQMA